MFYLPHLTIMEFSKNNLQWSCLPIFRLERPLTEKVKFKHLDGVFEMLSFLGILKICGFVYVRINFMM